jgi:hypothetical protein
MFRSALLRKPTCATRSPARAAVRAAGRQGGKSGLSQMSWNIACHQIVRVSTRRVEMEICAHMEVVDANDQHVGTVESIEGDRIKMFEKDARDPKELFLNKSQVAEVNINKVRLSQKVSAITTRAFLSPEHAEKITKKE